jgi:hypothetical protein
MISLALIVLVFFFIGKIIGRIMPQKWGQWKKVFIGLFIVLGLPYLALCGWIYHSNAIYDAQQNDPVYQQQQKDELERIHKELTDEPQQIQPRKHKRIEII